MASVNQKWNDILHVIGRVHDETNRYLISLMANEGITHIVPSHGDILMELFAHEPLTMAEISEAIGRDPSTVTALIKKLAESGYIERIPSDTDRRVTKICLTEKGRSFEKCMEQISHTLLETLTEKLTQEELLITHKTLNKMLSNANNALRNNKKGND